MLVTKCLTEKVPIVVVDNLERKDKILQICNYKLFSNYITHGIMFILFGKIILGYLEKKDWSIYKI